MNIVRLLCFLSFILAAVVSSHAQSTSQLIEKVAGQKTSAPLRSFSCGVMRVSDGDTLVAMTAEGTKLRVRLYGIDAPEINHPGKPGQPFGEEARQALQAKVAGKTVLLEIMDIDRYKRLVGIVRINNRNINREMISEGLAYAYRQYLDRPYASEFITEEDKARASKLGLWQQNAPVAPWEFRNGIRRQDG